MFRKLFDYIIPLLGGITVKDHRHSRRLEEPPLKGAFAWRSIKN